MQWHRLDNEKTQTLLDAIKKMGGSTLFNLQSSEAKCMRLPFTENVLFFRISNNMTMPSFTMDFLGDGSQFYYLDGTFTPFEKAFSLSTLDIDVYNLGAYLQFYFANVTQEDGEIYPVFEKSPIPDLDDQNVHATQQKVPDNAYVFDITAESETDFEADCTLFYDGGLMTGSLSINGSGKVEITGLKPLFVGTSSAFSETSKDQLT